MKTKKQKKATDSIAKMANDAQKELEAYLFDGSVFGASSLEAILAKYKKEGPFSPIRWDLIQYLSHCLRVAVKADALITARTKSMPYGRQNQYFDRQKAAFHRRRAAK